MTAQEKPEKSLATLAAMQFVAGGCAGDLINVFRLDLPLETELT